MRELFLLSYFLFFGFCVLAHPPIAIVQDSKGNIYYSDLDQVCIVSKGVKSIIVPHVHTHQLYIDKDNNLFGEHLEYEGEAINKFYHYLWRLNSNGVLDTIITYRQAYIQNDYSLARDSSGNEYYFEVNDTTHIYKRTPDGKEVVTAIGNFKDVSWLHVQKDGSLFFFNKNNVYKLNVNGIIDTVAFGICSNKPSFKHSHSPSVLGIWQDNIGNVFVACFSDRAVRKISPDGKVSIIYTSPDHWTPTNGMFDKDNKLWVLEASEQNEVRVTPLNSFINKSKSVSNLTMMIFFSICCISILVAIKYFQSRSNPGLS